MNKVEQYARKIIENGLTREDVKVMRDRVKHNDVDGLIDLIEKVNAELNNTNDEISALNMRKRSCKAVIEQIENVMLENIDEVGIDTEFWSVTKSRGNGALVVSDDFMVQSIDDAFKINKIELDKARAKRYLMSGIKIPGLSIEYKERVKIKKRS